MRFFPPFQGWYCNMLSNENIQSKDTDGVKRKEGREGKGMERKLDKLFLFGRTIDRKKLN